MNPKLAESRVQVGGGRVAVPCHFGEWLQGKAGADGPLALVTMIPEGIRMTARLTPASRSVCHATGFGPLHRKGMSLFLDSLGVTTAGRIEARLPFAPGLGTGMSTAVLLAAAALHGFSGPPDALAQSCIAAEGASDPLMFRHPDRLLWASRQGRVLGAMPPVPRAHILAGFFGPPHPTRADDQDYDDISDLLADWKRADSLAARAALASESARRCMARRGPADDPTEGLARDLGALGWIASHSGAARALVFAPGLVPVHGPEVMRQAGLRGIHRLATGAI